MRGFFRKLQGVESAPLPLSTPDVTKAQVGGWLQFAASVGIGVGLLKPAEAEVLIASSALIGASLHIADSIIRKGRAGAMAALKLNVPPVGGAMGSTAPDEGEELPPSPTLDGAPEVDVSLDGDGTGTTPPPDDEEAVEVPEPVEEAPAPAQEPTAPPAPPPPTPEELRAAQEAYDAAGRNLQALLARTSTTQA